MGEIRLSILIPSIPSRFSRANALYSRLLDMSQDMDVEILMLTDNKKRKIGQKREALKNASIGKYFMFVDDDDDMLDIRKIYDACVYDVDVITFKQRCRNVNGPDFMIDFSLQHRTVEHNVKDGLYLDCNRPPFHVCAWHRDFKRFVYPPVNYAEDWGWLRQVLPLARTEYKIDAVIHAYNFDPNVTEASTESNAVWTNPNPDKGQNLPEFGSNVSVRPEQRCVVNLVTNHQGYVMGQKRLHDSLESIRYDQNGDSRFGTSFFIGEDTLGSPLHSENPYAFKVHAINRMREEGYKQIFWLDASIIAVKDIEPLWKRLTERGMFMETAGHWAGTWCNEYTLKYFGLTREQAMKIPMFAAGYVGFDFTNPISIEFFAQWNEAMLNGCFKGSWSDHRHDMTCASIIAHRMGITDLYGEGGEFFAYIGEAYGIPKESVVCHLKGL